MSTIDRKLATIRKIDSIEPIENADNIELTHFGGWQTVVKKGEFHPGELAIFCEIDSVLPDHPEFDFLRNRKFRIKTQRLRGVLSQGIAFPLDIIEKVTGGKVEKNYGNKFDSPFFFIPKVQEHDVDFRCLDEGTDVTELLGITLYEIPVPVQLRGQIRGNFPSFIPRTDEERAQNLTKELEIWKDITFVATEKLDGTSCTFYIKDDDFHVCSRRMDYKETEDNLYWKVARQLDIENKMRRASKLLGNFAIQGEIVGESVQKNPLRLKGQHFFCFNIFDIDKHEYYDYEIWNSICKDIGIERVPILVGFGNNYKFEYNVKDTMEEWINLADGMSMITSTCRREGIVFRSVSNHKDLNPYGRVSFKIVSNEYLLKEK